MSYDPKRWSPWGAVQTFKEIAPGIYHVTTAGHGGFGVSEDRLKEMPKPLQEFETWAGRGWYEEDCDWAIVVIAFSSFFDTPTVDAARLTFGIPYFKEVRERYEAYCQADQNV